MANLLPLRALPRQGETLSSRDSSGGDETSATKPTALGLAARAAHGVGSGG